ncbi:uncharacterized protein LOC133814602 [Humulus lupulus]|uniref:uncharacterized protein LOC133814602 n=1 Tax=Humulus lupulus TaxID=3486 RepID=UPI002B412334|nr:uncharacterized protein LOC133814602 [Humulus lupulus]
MSLRHIEWLRFPLHALLVQIISNSGAHISQFLPNAIQSIVGAQIIRSLRNVNIQSDDIYACFTKSTNKAIEGKPWKTFYLSPKKDQTIFTDFDSSHRNWDKYFFAVGGAWYPEYLPQETFPLARVFIKDYDSALLDRVDPGAVRVRSQKGDMTLSKITTACAKQLGTFMKKSPPTSSTLSLSKTECERACSETYAACAKRQGVPKDALGKRKEREESSGEDSDDGKCISSKLRIPKGSVSTAQGSPLAIPKLSPGKLPTGQALTLCKKPRGSAPAGSLPGASSTRM